MGATTTISMTPIQIWTNSGVLDDMRKIVLAIWADDLHDISDPVRLGLVTFKASTSERDHGRFKGRLENEDIWVDAAGIPWFQPVTGTTYFCYCWKPKNGFSNNWRGLPVAMAAPTNRVKATNMFRASGLISLNIPSLTNEECPHRQGLKQILAGERYDRFPLDLVFYEFEKPDRDGKKSSRGLKSTICGVPIYTDSHSRHPPTGTEVRCFLGRTNPGNLLVVWSGLTTAQAEANAKIAASMQGAGASLAGGAINEQADKLELDWIACLGLAEVAEIDRGTVIKAVADLRKRSLKTEDEAKADPIFKVMAEAGFPLGESWLSETNCNWRKAYLQRASNQILREIAKANGKLVLNSSSPMEDAIREVLDQKADGEGKKEPEVKKPTKPPRQRRQRKQGKPAEEGQPPAEGQAPADFEEPAAS